MKIDTVTLKKQVILHLPYLLFLLVFAKLGQTVRLAPGADASQKLLGLSEGFTLAFQSMWPGAALDWLVGLCGAVIMRLAVYLKGKDAKKYRKNVEYGSARWGSKTDIAPFMDQKPENNIILTQSEGLMMSGRPKNPANARNKNVLMVGGSGSGKTRFFIKPNLMQMHSSYVVTDPKGTVLIEVGKLLSRGTPKLDKDGKETIDLYNTSVTKGTQESHGQNFQKLGKDLMSVDELAVMDGGKCLLQIRGVRPFLSRKYDITKHPNYKYLSDFDEKNAFDIEKYLSTRLPVRPRELYPNYEITPEELAAQTSA